jgi:peptidoglycan/xylan/chitin deacetylase (PgdA/CDA1 family)
LISAHEADNYLEPTALFDRSVYTSDEGASVVKADFQWPRGLHPDTICFTVDVEWAAEEVLADLRQLFDQHGVRATFFVTHAGVETPGHERGLHPNFRRNGDSYKQLRAIHGREDTLTDEQIHTHIVSTTLAFAPEAKGLRAHSLHYDSTLLQLYRKLGLEYDCSYQMPLVGCLRPFWKHHDIVEIPTYYGDHFDLITGATGFNVAGLGLERPGLKVFDFHPNIVFINAASDADYLATKSFYHDHERLLAARRSGKGSRTLLLELLEAVRRNDLHTVTVGEVNTHWRTVAKWT